MKEVKIGAQLTALVLRAVTAKTRDFQADLSQSRCRCTEIATRECRSRSVAVDSKREAVLPAEIRMLKTRLLALAGAHFCVPRAWFMRRTPWFSP